jgi:hypothetical protein
LLPWTLVGLVAVAGLVGALVGVSNQPSPPATQPTVSQIVAATRAVGTARFTFSSVARSKNPLLRSLSAGSGAVDFRSRSVISVERDESSTLAQDGTAPSHQVTQTVLNDQIWVGQTFYSNFGVVGQHYGIGWIKAKLPNESSGPLGLLDEVTPIGFLDSELGIRGTKIELLRSEVLGGETTTKYRVAVPTCSRPSSPQSVLGSISIWLDGEGRLVQVRDVLHSTDPIHPVNGRSTTISIARFFDFGAPVAISPPKAVLPQGQAGVALIALSPKGCPK